MGETRQEDSIGLNGAELGLSATIHNPELGDIQRTNSNGAQSEERVTSKPGSSSPRDARVGALASISGTPTPMHELSSLCHKACYSSELPLQPRPRPNRRASQPKCALMYEDVPVG